MTAQGTSIGVCGWSIDRFDVLRSIDYAGAELGLSTVQVGFFRADVVEQADASVIADHARAVAVRAIWPFLAFEHEDYSTFESIAQTGGFASDEHYAGRLDLLQRTAVMAAGLDASGVAIHAGTVPARSADPMYVKLKDRVRQAADMLGEAGDLTLLLESGRESAETLAAFLSDVDRPNVGVNYDSGNFVVFGSDDPVRAVRTLGDLILNVHVKDAKASAQPGVSYGSPALVGMGDADIPRVLSKLRLIAYRGPLLIEANTRMFGLECLTSGVDYLRSMMG